MTDAEAADSLNTANRSVDREFVNSSEIFEALDRTEYQALTAGDTKAIDLILGLGGEISVNGTNTRGTLLAVFGAGTTTRANLLVLASRTVSRANELGLGTVLERQVRAERRV
jgi:hypothetical protein